VISRGLLYRKDKVEGQSVCQLCVPVGRRENVLKFGHDSVFGGHMGERKASQRIKLSFYWPGLKKSVRQYTASCKDCQLRSRKLTTDRVPITPITRDEVPYQTLNMDCIGPLDPPSSQGHKYCLCIVDNCTRWLSVYMLKSLTAKAVCDVLLDLFVTIGVSFGRCENVDGSDVTEVADDVAGSDVEFSVDDEMMSLLEWMLLMLFLSMMSNLLKCWYLTLLLMRGILPSVRVQPEKVAYLEESRRTELLRLLDGYADCFSDQSVLCDVVTHQSVTTPDFVFKPMRPRRVAEVFRLKVNRKVRELLDPGLFHLPGSSIANPVVRNTTEVTVKNAELCS